MGRDEAPDIRRFELGERRVGEAGRLGRDGSARTLTKAATRRCSGW